MDDKKMNIKNWPRHTIQALWAALTNSHISGFVTGKIYTGKLKKCLCSGTELLFMSRGSRSLSNWILTGRGWKLEL